MRKLTLAEALPVLMAISKRLEKLHKIEQLVETRTRAAALAAGLRDVRVGIKSELAGMLQRMERDSETA